jgi:hypothetical protein
VENRHLWIQPRRRSGARGRHSPQAIPATIALILLYFGKPALLGSQQFIHHAADLRQCAHGCR